MLRGKGWRDDPVDIAHRRHRFPGGGLLGGGTDIDRLDGRWLFGGPLWGHFGHFFADCIHRLWALKATGASYDGIVFLAVQGLEGVRTPADLAAATPPPLLADLMDLLDMPPVRVELIRAPTLIDRLDVPPPGTALRNPVAPFYRPYLAAYQQTLTDKLAVHIRRAPERLYLGRSPLLHKGGILGSSHIETVLQRAGFYAATPEAMRLPLQLGHLMGARTVVMDEGSAAHPTQVFDRIDTAFLMLPRRPGNATWADGIGQRASFASLVEDANVAILPDRFGSTGSPSGLAVYRDPGAVHAALAGRGLISEAHDGAAWAAAEDADLAASGSQTPAVLRQRRAALDAVQAARR
jgi:hypothetical protein